MSEALDSVAALERALSRPPSGRGTGTKEGNVDRDKMLDVTLQQIEKQFGKGAVMKLGEHPMGEGIGVIPTGSLALDLALGVGGIPRGRIVEVFGARTLTVIDESVADPGTSVALRVINATGTAIDASQYVSTGTVPTPPTWANVAPFSISTYVTAAPGQKRYNVQPAGGGTALFAPDYVRETFQPGTDHGGSDGPARALRFLEWTNDPDPSDTSYQVDFAFLLREADGSVRVEHDRHVLGLFSRDHWLRVLSEGGFQARLASSTADRESAAQCLFVAHRPT